MRKIAILNQKGGSGKTTTTVNLAAALAEKKKKVLVVDLDSQAATTSWFNQSCNDKSILNTLTENQNINTIVKDTEIKNIKLIPASSQLIHLEKVLYNDSAKSSLKSQFNILDNTNRDYLLVDCPSNLSFLTINVLASCQEVIIPIECRIAAISCLVKLLETVNIVKKHLNSNLKIAGIIICRVDLRNRHSKEMIDVMKDKFENLTYKTFIRENVTLSQAWYYHKTILQHDTECSGAQDYRSLAKEIINQEEYFIDLTVKQKGQQTNL